MHDNLQAFGLFKAGLSAREVGKKLDIPYSAALKLKNKLKEATDTDEVLNLINVERTIVEGVAGVTASVLAEIGADTEEVAKEVEGVIDKIDDYRLLGSKLNSTAVRIVDSIERLSLSCLDARELQLLTQSLALLQTSFFTKPAQIAVFPNATIDKFNDIKRD